MTDNLIYEINEMKKKKIRKKYWKNIIKWRCKTLWKKKNEKNILLKSRVNK